MSARGGRVSVRRSAALLMVCLSLLVPLSARSKIHRKTSAEPAERDPEGRVTDVRYWSRSDATRIAVEVTSDFEFRYDHLSSPERIFFDISGVKPARILKGSDRIPVRDRFLKRIRVAETQPGTTRIVLDLSSPVKAVASQLSNPNRLMIELRAAQKGETVLEFPAVVAAPTFQAPVSRAEIPSKLPTVRIDAPRIKLPSPKPDPVLERAAVATVPHPPAPAPAIDPPMRSETPAETLYSTPKYKEPGIAARRNSSGDRSLTRVLGLKLERVVLDPGHGGQDAGTRGATGLLEKDLVLDIAKRLGALIESRLGSEVVFTRDDDTFVPLEERTRIANRRKADLFLSIHANSSPAPSASGIETYYLNFTTSKSALDLAARENASSERSIYDLRDLVQKIALKDKLEESREFAARVQNQLATVSAKANANSKDRGVKKAPFVVLIGASMPSVLAEVGFVSNPHDENLMKKGDYRQRIAEALYKGIAQYAAGLSHTQVARQKSAE